MGCAHATKSAARRAAKTRSISVTAQYRDPPSRAMTMQLLWITCSGDEPSFDISAPLNADSFPLGIKISGLSGLIHPNVGKVRAVVSCVVRQYQGIGTQGLRNKTGRRSSIWEWRPRSTHLIHSPRKLVDFDNWHS